MPVVNELHVLIAQGRRIQPVTQGCMGCTGTRGNDQGWWEATLIVPRREGDPGSSGRM